MDLKVETQIPCLDFTNDPRDLVEGSDGWKVLSSKVREACEGYGCFQVVYNKVPTQLYKEMFKVTEELFDLPDEIKVKNIGSKPYYGYIGKYDEVPLYESLGIEGATKLEVTQAFTKLMWPDGGNPVFCQTVNSMSSKMYDLELIIIKLIMESYGVEKYYTPYIESNDSVFRMMRYKAPESSTSQLGLASHIDKSALTILYQNSVQGLEILSKDNNWIQAVPLPGAFVVFMGEALKAWSNGRLPAVKHRVMMSGEKTRYSFALFSTPRDGIVIEAPKELVDKEHPQLFRPFMYTDFLTYYYTSRNEDNALEVYAGI